MQQLRKLINSYHWETIQKKGESYFIEECIADTSFRLGVAWGYLLAVQGMEISEFQRDPKAEQDKEFNRGLKSGHLRYIIEQRILNRRTQILGGLEFEE